MALFSKASRLKFVFNLQNARNYAKYKTKLYMKAAFLKSEDSVDEMVKKYAPRVYYNTIIERKVVRYEYLRKMGKSKMRRTIESEEPIPLCLKYLNDDIAVESDELAVINEREVDKGPNFPFSSSVHTVEDMHLELPLEPKAPEPIDLAAEANREVQERYKLLKEMKTWMVSYDNYDDRIKEEEESVVEWRINYGTPDPTSKASDVPCGGCGAHLHCKDTAIPGYIPSEIFRNSMLEGGSNLQAVICQRCHFLKSYNVALQVQVAAEDYPKVLATISQKKGLVVLMIDLLDFPCSIWPGIGEIFKHNVPIVVVGNKIDLLPHDSKEFLKNVRKTLSNYIKLQGFATHNIKDVVLVSARTGYGIEELITKLNTLHVLKGDVYIVGCTNVGKSSLFNAFLQSDFCKLQAMDLIQRATTSVWPGTTLNLLKFPIKRPSGFRQFLRQKRLEVMQRLARQERTFRIEQLRTTRNPAFASLIGHVGVTKNLDPEECADSFLMQHSRKESGIFELGVDEKHKDFIYSKWCFDTPGVVQPDQIIHLLTTDELLLTLPKELILPRTFCVKPSSSLFIGGLARLDYLSGDTSVRLVVFASNELPITICSLGDADEMYDELLGTDLFRVPCGSEGRLSRWPKLEKDKEFRVKGKHWNESVSDVVLSSAGWVALAGRDGLEYTFQAWTPEKRGIYLRDCLLPHAVALSGRRIKYSVAYEKYRFYLQ